MFQPIFRQHFGTLNGYIHAHAHGSYFSHQTLLTLKVTTSIGLATQSLCLGLDDFAVQALGDGNLEIIFHDLYICVLVNSPTSVCTQQCSMMHSIYAIF